MAEHLDAALAVVRARCTASGLDLHAATTVGAYDAMVDAPFRLGAHPSRAVAVIGNTREIWPHVERWVHDHPHETDPVDALVVDTVGRAVEALDVPVLDVRFSHEPPPRRIAIQRLADAAGMAWLAPSHLCVHPTVGPWMALRAAVVLDVAGVETQAATPICDCPTGCLPALDRALAAGEPTTEAEIRDHWLLWLGMRDACPIGRDHRYTDEQIRYHYIGQRPSSWPPLGTVGP